MIRNVQNEYFDKPAGAPPNYGNQNQNTQQPNYSNQTQDRGMFSHNQPQQGYYQQPQQGYYQQPPTGQYYQQQQQPYYQPQQQQPMYVQQQPRSGGNESCLMGCLAALCVCCTLDMLF